MSTASDRNLLFGVLALQIDAVTGDQLIQAMLRWVADKTRSLGGWKNPEVTVCQVHDAVAALMPSLVA